MALVYRKLERKDIENLPDEDIREFLLLNSDLDESEISYLDKGIDAVAIGCADARSVLEALVDMNEKKVRVLSNAANQFVPGSVELIPGRAYFFFAHGIRKDDGGMDKCGGCHGAHVYSDLPDDEKEKFRAEDPDLHAVCSGADTDIVENLKKQIKSFHEYAKSRGIDVDVFGILTEHGTQKVLGFYNVDSPSAMGWKEMIEKHNKKYAEKHSPIVKSHGKDHDIRKGQNPVLIVYSEGMKNNVADYSGRKSRFQKPNQIFTVDKDMPGLDALHSGSIKYAADKVGKGGDFHNSKMLVVVRDSEEGLASTLKELDSKRFIHDFLRKGRGYAMVPGERHRLRLYRIEEKKD